MNDAMDDHYRELNADLGLEFHLFTLEQPVWTAKNIPQGAIVVMQTDDPRFNAWVKRIAEANRRSVKPPPPVVLVHVRELRRRQSRIVAAEVELVTSVLA